MLEQYFHRRPVLERIERNLLGEHLGALTEHLHRRGHCANSVQAYVQAAEHFGHWLSRARHTVEDVDAQLVEVFLARHLPRCRCPAPCSRTVATVRAALHQLLAVMLPSPTTRAAPPTPVDEVVSRFDSYLAAACGLADTTRISHCRHVREFLATRFGARSIDLATLGPGDVAAFVSRRAAGLAPASVNRMATAMRSFLRHLQLVGIGDPRWIAAVPGVASWSLAALPPVLTEAELTSFLAAFDRTTASGRRGFAIALCFADLGLRCGEVARLALDDVDWRAGLLTIAPGKSRNASQLPLPPRLLRALADYLRRGRPPTPAREIFVHHRAPLGSPLGPSGVRSAVRVAYRRAGLDDRWTGTHVLRHTAATRMLRAGVSLKEIADVLGHRSLDTSAIYAKVDREALARVAMSWPGAQP
jgi:site-specific recombinase XerD